VIFIYGRVVIFVKISKSGDGGGSGGLSEYSRVEGETDGLDIAPYF
jgi:hypothetical protein